jgi:hypothetical protein
VAVSARHGLLSCVGGDTGTTGCRDSNRIGNPPAVRASAARCGPRALAKKSARTTSRGISLHGGAYAVSEQHDQELRACRSGCAIRLVSYRDTLRHLTAQKRPPAWTPALFQFAADLIAGMTICPTTHREVMRARCLHPLSAWWTFLPFLRAPSFAATATAISRESGDPPFATATMNIWSARPEDLRRRSYHWGQSRALSACHALFCSLALPSQSGKRTQPRKAP